MTSNFLLNNELTYRDRRLKGWGMLRGFVLFCLVCSVGVLANVDLASWLYVERPIWWVAGAVGAVMSALWNYAMSTLVRLARAMMLRPRGAALGARSFCSDCDLPRRGGGDCCRCRPTKPITGCGPSIWPPAISIIRRRSPG